MASFFLLIAKECRPLGHTAIYYVDQQKQIWSGIFKSDYLAVYGGAGNCISHARA